MKKLFKITKKAMVEYREISCSLLIEVNPCCLDALVRQGVHEQQKINDLIGWTHNNKTNFDLKNADFAKFNFWKVRVHEEIFMTESVQ